MESFDLFFAYGTGEDEEREFIDSFTDLADAKAARDRYVENIANDQDAGEVRVVVIRRQT